MCADLRGCELSERYVGALLGGWRLFCAMVEGMGQANYGHNEPIHHSIALKFPCNFRASIPPVIKPSPSGITHTIPSTSSLPCLKQDGNIKLSHTTIPTGELGTPSALP